MAVNKATSLHNPFNTFTNYVYPKTMQDVFEWALWFWNRNHKYRTCIQKVITYFVAGLNVTAKHSNDEVDTDQIDAFKALLLDVYDILPTTVKIGLLLAAMGNVFISALRAFTRDLCCPTKGCGFTANILKMSKGIDYTWLLGKFMGKCPKCRKSVLFTPRDSATTLPDGRKVRFICRAAQDMRLNYNALTDLYSYLYRLPDHIKNGILSGLLIYLRTTPMLYIKAALSNDLIEFDKTKFFFLRTLTLSLLDKLYKGWGVPLFLASFGNLLRLAMLDRFNLAVVMLYIAPMRLISPDPRLLQAGSLPARNPISGDFFRQVMTKAVKTNNANPTTWVVAPFPVNYQMIGGLAKQMAPVELMLWYVTQILSDMGIPQLFRQTTFQVVSPSMGLRVFLRMWIHFVKNLNKFVRWAATQVALAHRVLQLDVSLDTTSFVLDDFNKQVRLQLMQGGIISKEEGLSPFGIDHKLDAKKMRLLEAAMILRDQLMQASMQGILMVSSVMPPGGGVGVMQAQQNIDNAMAAAQGMPPLEGAAPAAPMGPAGAPPMPFGQGNSLSATMLQLYSRALAEADRIYGVGQQFGPAARKQELRALRLNDKILHAQVIQLLLAKDRQVASQAVAQSNGSMR